MTYLAPADKLTHIVVGVGITLVALPLGWAWAAGLCALAATAREIWGMTHGGRFDPVDLLGTLAGGGAVLAAAFIGLGG